MQEISVEELTKDKKVSCMQPKVDTCPVLEAWLSRGLDLIL